VLCRHGYPGRHGVGLRRPADPQGNRESQPAGAVGNGESRADAQAIGRRGHQRLPAARTERQAVCSGHHRAAQCDRGPGRDRLRDCLVAVGKRDHLGQARP